MKQTLNIKHNLDNKVHYYHQLSRRLKRITRWANRLTGFAYSRRRLFARF